MKILHALGLLAAAILAAQDIHYRKINVLFAGTVWAVAAVVRLVSGESALDVAVCTIAGLLLIGLSYVTDGIGPGDGFAVGMAMSCLGFVRGIQTVALSFIVICATALVLLAVKKVGRKTELPYVPWLLAAYALGGVWL